MSVDDDASCGWVGGGGGGRCVGGGGGRWVGGGGGLPPLPTHPPLRFTREQTRVEYIRRCRLTSTINNRWIKTLIIRRINLTDDLIG